MSYVGSGPWAQYMVDVGTRHGKRVHAHGALRHLHVVADGADPAVAARRVCASAIGVAGQRWLAGCTVVTGATIASTFVDELCAAAAAVRVGSSTDPATSMGPVVQRFRQRELVDRVRDVGEGVDVLVDGSSYADGCRLLLRTHRARPRARRSPVAGRAGAGPDHLGGARRRSAADIDHRDAHGTVTTIHGGAPPAATPGWFGSLPWSWDHAIRFFTTA